MAVTGYEHNFINTIMNIFHNGYLVKNERTGKDTKRIANQVISVDLEKELPIIKSKKVHWKSAVDEILWIFQKGSNRVEDLNSKIWDSWAGEDGTIGKAYGYQISRFDQVHRVLSELERDPSSRRAVIDLWNNEDLSEMNLTPCVYTSTWNIIDGKLNVCILQRSCDILVGGVFNLIQYAVLNHLFARHLGVRPGVMTFMFADCHVYADQLEGLEKWKSQWEYLFLAEFVEGTQDTEALKEALSMTSPESAYDEIGTQVKDLLDDTDIFEVVDCTPTLWLNPEKTDFWSFTLDDIDIHDYKCMGGIKFPVAV